METSRMKCSKCQTENPESKKFCRKCGAKLLKQCPQCGSESLPEDEFCVREEDGDFEIGEKIKKGLGVLRVGESSTLPYFLELLSVKDSGIDRISMSPEGKRIE
jgi:ribosomal protein L40E